jgi:ATP-dependent DNA ligase
MKTLAELQAECAARGITVKPSGRASKEPYIAALRGHLWRQEHLDGPLASQVQPMLLGSWDDLDPGEAEAIEQDQHAWCVQEKKDGVRALLHVQPNGIRITGRTISEVTYRLSEFHANLTHLATDLDALSGSILDGELLCPAAQIDTGDTVTAHSLQATVVILATSPDNAKLIQDRHQAHLQFHAFDILSFGGHQVTSRPLSERIDLLRQTLDLANNSHLHLVSTFVVGKPAVHRRVIESGGEGTVWKRMDSLYEPGRRVSSWLKRKTQVTVEAVVIGAKPGTPGKGHDGLIGAVEFGLPQPDGTFKPIAWVSALSDEERRSMTQTGPAGMPQISPALLGRRALITDQDHSAKSGRLRHARLVSWVDG